MRSWSPTLAACGHPNSATRHQCDITVANDREESIDATTRAPWASCLFLGAPSGENPRCCQGAVSFDDVVVRALKSFLVREGREENDI